jgi:hypothetical protein
MKAIVFLTYLVIFFVTCNFHDVLSHQKNNTIMNAHETPILRTFKLFYITKALQLKHNTVIAMSLNHLTIGVKQ